MKIYTLYPADIYQNKTEIYDWCHRTFGPGNVEENGWSVTSHYDERPIYKDEQGNLVDPCPFKFTTNDPAKLTLFALRWS